MKSPVDTTASATFLRNAVEKHSGLLHLFGQFRDHAANCTNPYLRWTVSALATNKRSFEVEYLTLKLRVVLTIRPTVDQRGVITFFRLDDFDPDIAAKIGSVDFDAENGATSLQDRPNGGKMYVGLEAHDIQLIVVALHEAYLMP